MAKRKIKSVRDYAKQLASMGGKARAKKYDPETLSKWASLGGRPRIPEDQLTDQGKWARARRARKRRERESTTARDRR